MLENDLARKVLAKTSVKFAQRRRDEILYEWIRDIWQRPNAYRDQILNAPVEYQPKLNRLLDLYLELEKLPSLYIMPPPEIESEITELGNTPAGHLIISFYFDDRPELRDEFFVVMETIQAAGLYPP